MKYKSIKIIVILLISLFAYQVKGEKTHVIIYFDKNWVVCKPEDASYYRKCDWDNELNYYDGEFTDYLINDTKISQGSYTKGKKEGDFNFFFESGNNKITGYFKDNKPDSLWCWYYPGNKLSYKIKFSSDQFEIKEVVDTSGNTLLNETYRFTFDFQNDSLNPDMKIVGKIENSKKEGKWKVMSKNKMLGFDLYKGGKYLKTNFICAIPSNSYGKIINNDLFIPYSLFACEKLDLKNNITDEDYPFLSYRFPWEPIELAYGIIGDSTLYQIDTKPMYIGGIKGLNRAIANNAHLTIDIIENCEHWGYVYYEMIIDKNGRIQDTRIIKTPDIRFTKIILKSFENLKSFKPAYHMSMPIKSKFTSRVKFMKPTVIYEY